METIIAKALNNVGRKSQASAYLDIASKRKAAVIKYCWNSEAGFFFDYNIRTKSQNSTVTAAGLFPLFVKMATRVQASVASATTKKFLLKDGGVVTTTSSSGQQWDAPNWWAPLQWTSVIGLKNYGQNDLAKNIAQRWLALNDKVYAATGKMMEKYNVEEASKEAVGGEYPSQDGFGWTNGVYPAFKTMYARKK